MRSSHEQLQAVIAAIGRAKNYAAFYKLPYHVYRDTRNGGYVCVYQKLDRRYQLICTIPYPLEDNHG